MKRRTFIKNCSLSALGVAGVSSLLTACQTSEVRPSVVNMNIDSELEVHKNEFSAQSYILLEHPRQSQPICLFKTGSDKYTASLMSCTHQKCTTSVVGEKIVCPCHGSRFDNEGKVLNGPAERDLTTYKTRVMGDTIFVSLS